MRHSLLCYHHDAISFDLPANQDGSGQTQPLRTQGPGWQPLSYIYGDERGSPRHEVGVSKYRARFGSYKQSNKYVNDVKIAGDRAIRLRQANACSEVDVCGSLLTGFPI